MLAPSPRRLRLDLWLTTFGCNNWGVGFGRRPFRVISANDTLPTVMDR